MSTTLSSNDYLDSTLHLLITNIYIIFNQACQDAVNFINVIRPLFLYKILVPNISNPKYSFEIFGDKISYKNHRRKMLMKFTLGGPIACLMKPAVTYLNQSVT